MKLDQFMFALSVAVGSGMAAVSHIDYTGIDYRQHPIATILGTLLPSVIAGVIIYFMAPRIVANFRLNATAAWLGDKNKLLLALGLLIMAIAVASFVASPARDKPNPFDQIHDQDPEPAEASPRIQCFKNAQAAYNSALMALFNADPVAAASDGGRSVIAQRRALEAYCTAIAGCQFERSSALNYTQAFSYCTSSAEKDMQAD